jgi:hypothetical protein
VFDGYDERAEAVMQEALLFARMSGTLGSVELLVAVSEASGPAAAALRSEPLGLRAVAFGQDSRPLGSGSASDFHAMQIMGSVREWAVGENRLVSPEHLIVALADQANGDVVALCDSARIDLRRARGNALAVLGWSLQQVPSLAPLIPAGMMDRPPLPIADLPEAAWAEAQRRLERLPFPRVRRRSQWDALESNERRAAWRLADKHDLDDDQRFSLLVHYGDAVDRLAAIAIPQLLPRPSTHSEATGVVRASGRRRSFARIRVGNLLGNWAYWFGNRRVGIRDRWFRLTWRY